MVATLLQLIIDMYIFGARVGWCAKYAPEELEILEACAVCQCSIVTIWISHRPVLILCSIDYIICLCSGGFGFIAFPSQRPIDSALNTSNSADVVAVEAKSLNVGLEYMKRLISSPVRDGDYKAQAEQCNSALHQSEYTPQAIYTCAATATIRDSKKHLVHERLSESSTNL